MGIWGTPEINAAYQTILLRENIKKQSWICGSKCSLQHLIIIQIKNGLSAPHQIGNADYINGAVGWPR